LRGELGGFSAYALKLCKASRGLTARCAWLPAVVIYLMPVSHAGLAMVMLEGQPEGKKERRTIIISKH